MDTTTPARLARLDTILEARRKQVRFRLAMAGCIILFYQQMLGLGPTLVWAGLYGLLQFAELKLLPPERRLAVLATTVGRRMALALILLNTLVFGSLAVLWPLKAGAWGAANGAFLIAGSLLNTVLTTKESKAAFHASALPLVIYAAVLPAVALVTGCRPDLALGLAIGGAMLVVTSLKLWNGAHAADVAEQAARADAERRRAEAESAVAAKSTFVAMVSHDLRTPISAILAGASELERVSDGVAKVHARLISDAGAMMRTLLNDLLDLAKLDAGRMTVEDRAFDYRAMVADQLRFWRADARKKGLALRLTGAASAPRWIRGDATRLRQILNNLLSNALKFTEQGAVTVSLATTTREDGRMTLRIEIADTGRGMSADEVARLFQPYEQADASIARTYGGTGLGLVISRQLARMMEGDITVESTAGQGSCFTVTLVAAAAEATHPEVAAPAAQPGRAMRVLVVDDHEINRRALSLLLAPAGAEIALAASGREALSLLAAQPFDVVLMDVHMPDMSGQDAVMRLRLAIGPNRWTPVIAVTGATEDAVIKACLAAGMNDWVAKPIDAGQLYAALERQLEGRDAA